MDEETSLLHRISQSINQGRPIKQIDLGLSASSPSSESYTTPLGKASSYTSYNNDAFAMSVLDSVHVLIGEESNIEVADDEGNTAAHWAVLHERLRFLSVLILKGCDVGKLRNKEGELPIHWAARYSTAKSYFDKLLQGNSRSVSAKNVRGETPLHLLCARDCAGLVDVLLQYGACVNALSGSGDLPLHVAARHLQPKVIEVLCQRHSVSEISMQNKKMNTPLHEVVNSVSECAGDEQMIERGVKCIQILLDNGGLVTVRNLTGATVEGMSSQCGIPAVCELVRKTGSEGRKVVIRNKIKQSSLNSDGLNGTDVKGMTETVTVVERSSYQMGNAEVQIAVERTSSSSSQGEMIADTNIKSKLTTGGNPTHFSDRGGVPRESILVKAATEGNGSFFRLAEEEGCCSHGTNSRKASEARPAKSSLSTPTIKEKEKSWFSKMFSC